MSESSTCLDAGVGRFCPVGGTCGHPVEPRPGGGTFPFNPHQHLWALGAFGSQGGPGPGLAAVGMSAVMGRDSAESTGICFWVEYMDIHTQRPLLPSGHPRENHAL